jgi:16S rRNA G966 N2-methylase RsmD
MATQAIVVNQIVAVGGLRPHPQNYNRHDSSQVADLRASLRKFGQVRSIVVQADAADGHLIVAGHGVVAAAQAAGLTTLRADVIPADWPPAKVLAYLAADNELARRANPDEAQLAALVAQVQQVDAELAALAAGSEARLAELLASVNQELPGDPGAALARAEELKAKYGVEKGQIWQLERHRVGCGDAYDQAFLERLILDAKVALLHTDPPYGINIVQPKGGRTTAAIGGSKPFTGGTSGTQRRSGAAERSARAERGYVQHGKPSRNQRTQSNEWPVMVGDQQRSEPTEPVGSGHIIQSNLYPVIQGDDRPFDPESLLSMAPIVILWGANYYADRLPISSCWIVWDKREDITRNTFADCELAWTNMDKPSRLFHHLWNGLHKGSQHNERRTHPTEKPVALFEEIGKLFCPAGVWLDLFAGTGAQVIAAERGGTTCLACEIEPLYVATILERWATMTGKTPVRMAAGDGQHG